MEKSKFTRFCRMQNLRHLFSRVNLPPELFPAIEAYEQRYKINIRGTLLEEMGMDSSNKPKKKFGSLDEDSLLSLRTYLANQATSNGKNILLPLSKFTALHYEDRAGQRFQAGESRNSFVIFRLWGHMPNLPSTISPGRIISLLRYTSGSSIETYAIVKIYQGLSPASTFDYFQRFPPAAGYLTYNKLKTENIVVPFSDIISHFVGTPIVIGDEDYMHILSLR